MRDTDQRRLDALEAAYVAALRAALERCAAGAWGLFGQNDRSHATLSPGERAKLAFPGLDDLLELAAEIARTRDRLGYAEPFAPHARLTRERSRKGANVPGEPRLAAAWLEEWDG